MKKWIFDLPYLVYIFGLYSLMGAVGGYENNTLTTAQFLIMFSASLFVPYILYKLINYTIHYLCNRKLKRVMRFM